MKKSKRESRLFVWLRLKFVCYNTWN